MPRIFLLMVVASSATAQTFQNTYVDLAVAKFYKYNTQPSTAYPDRDCRDGETNCSHLPVDVTLSLCQDTCVNGSTTTACRRRICENPQACKRWENGVETGTIACVTSSQTVKSDGVLLTNSELGTAWPLANFWAGWQGAQEVTITLDLGTVRAVNHFKLHAQSHTAWGIRFPAGVTVSTSTDGSSYQVRGAFTFPLNSVDFSQATGELTTSFVNARFVRMTVTHVSDWMMLDYLGVWGTAVNASPKNVPASGVLHGAYHTRAVPICPTAPACDCSIAGQCSWPLLANEFEALVGNKPLAMVLWYADWTDWSDWATSGTRTTRFEITHHPVASAVQGRNLMVALVPSYVTSREINRGLADIHATEFLADAASFSAGDPARFVAPYALWFRLMNEMEYPSHYPDNVYSTLEYGVPLSDALVYVKAYQRIYNIAEQVGATGAKHAWVWSPGECCGGTMAYYPGDAYVDWAGLSVYSSSGYTSPDGGVAGADKGTNGACVNPFNDYVTNWIANMPLNKPRMISEGGFYCKAPSPGYQQFRNTWINQWMAAPTNPNFAPYLRALVFFSDGRTPEYQFNSGEAASYGGAFSPSLVTNFIP